MIPSELYRSSVKQLCTQYKVGPGGDSGTEFKKYLEENYDQAKNWMAGKPFNNENERTATRNALFVFAVGLFAYGRKDTVNDIIDNILSSGHVQRLALSLKAMLPMPNEIDPLKDAGRAREWLMANREKIRWNESEGFYSWI